MDNDGTERVCENCSQECLATLYCEYCIRNYLEENFSNWTSGNDDIDNLIQTCQMESLTPTDWINGNYDEWDSKEQQLKRFGTFDVILKKLENVESANQSWFEEAKSHLTISNKWADIVQCYGLTQNPSNGNIVLVMVKLDIDLRNYLQQKNNQLTWKERINIAYEIILALVYIHNEKAIHGDLHSGNILNSELDNSWYATPEVIIGSEYTFASDIYSIAMLMWEISSGQPPLINYERENDIVMNIINGIRPKIVPGTPLEYKNLMVQCWDADPLKRPHANVLESFHSKLYDFNIPNNDSEKLPKEFINLQINSNKIIQQKTKKQNIGDIDDDDDVMIQTFIQKNKMIWKFLMTGFKFSFVTISLLYLKILSFIYILS
ncbi:kinase-like domain-containing protein [Rhizophagus diaphanus]|nr:kinase-like domain-containing protein [Rhizophagus diaphanus] [Rhizophagus sp. MUCL 43196]